MGWDSFVSVCVCPSRGMSQWTQPRGLKLLFLATLIVPVLYQTPQVCSRRAFNSKRVIATEWTHQLPWLQATIAVSGGLLFHHHCLCLFIPLPTLLHMPIVLTGGKVQEIPHQVMCQIAESIRYNYSEG